MNAPVTYIEDFISHEYGDMFGRLWEGLPWERRSDAPRRECWMNDYDLPYTYGREPHARTYEAKPWNNLALAARLRIFKQHGVRLEACFINGYEGPRDHLGWHADEGEIIDQTKPIAVISLGSARNIYFREKGSKEHESLLLAPNSLLLMHAGMQATHEHRIPKHPADCGARISLTYRGLLNAS